MGKYKGLEWVVDIIRMYNSTAHANECNGASEDSDSGSENGGGVAASSPRSKSKYGNSDDLLHALNMLCVYVMKYDDLADEDIKLFRKRTIGEGRTVEEKIVEMKNAGMFENYEGLKWMVKIVRQVHES